MNESYTELLVKKEQNITQKLLRIVCTALTVVLILGSFMMVSVSLFIVAVLFGVLDYFVFQWTDVEYEYLYLDKEISIDKIFAKTRRKKGITIDVNKIEIMAPEKSHHLDSYRNRQVKTSDYSAGKDLPDQKLYAVYYEGSQKYLLNLTDDFLKNVRGVIPRKVFTE